MRETEKGSLAMHLDTEVQQLQVGLVAAVHHAGHVYPVFIGQNEDTVAFFVGNQGIKGDRGLCSFLAQKNAAGIGGTYFQGEIIGRADRNELCFKGGVGGFLVSTAAFTGKCQANHRQHQRADESFAHQLFHPYGS